MPSGPAPIVVAEEPDDTPRVEPAVLSVEAAGGGAAGTGSHPPPPPNLDSSSPPLPGPGKSKPPPPPREPSYSGRPSIRIDAFEAEGTGGEEMPSSKQDEDEEEDVSRDSNGRLSKGGSPTGSERLDDSIRYVKGGGILASMKDVSVAPTEFAEGCKLLQACALGDRTRVEALLRVNKGHVNFRD
jgi:hypothetical protein